MIRLVDMKIYDRTSDFVTIQLYTVIVKVNHIFHEIAWSELRTRINEFDIFSVKRFLQEGVYLGDFTMQPAKLRPAWNFA